MKNIANKIFLISLSVFTTSCAVKYIEPMREGNSVIRFINQNASVTFFEDATECTSPYDELPWPELTVKSSKELAFSISTNVGVTTNYQYLYCDHFISFIPKPYTYYTVNSIVPRNTRSCILEIMERVSKNGSYSYAPYKGVVYKRKRKGTIQNLFSAKPPHCYPLNK